MISEHQVSKSLQGVTVPPEPQILVDIHMEQAMPAPDLDQIAQLIAQDPGLSGSVLKLVNSCFDIPLAQQVECIIDAVNMIGLDPIVNIVNGLSIKGELSDQAVVNMTRFWDSATDVATVAMMIANKIEYGSPDAAYNLGLFHNSGIPLLLKSHPDFLETMVESYAQKDERIIDVENARYKTNHAVVGYYVAKSWHCSKDLCQVIADHHNADRIFNSQYYQNYGANKKTLLAILKLSEHICGLYRILGNQEADHEWAQIKTPLMDYLGLTSYDYEGLLDLTGEVLLNSDSLSD